MAVSQGSSEAVRLVEQTIHKQQQELAVRRVKRERHKEDTRRRRLVVSRHLQHKAEEAEEKLREGARLEAMRAQRKAASDNRFAGMLESLEAGSAMCRRIDRETLVRHERGKRRQLEELHTKWEERVAGRLSEAIVSHVERVPVKIRRRQRVELSDAYNREAEHGAVFVDTAGGGKTGYDPFLYSQPQVRLQGRVDDPTKAALQREAREARMTLDSRLPAAAAEALGLRKPAAKRSGHHAEASPEWRASRAPPGRLPATGPGVQRMRSTVTKGSPGRPGHATSVLYEVDSSLPRAAVSTSSRRRGGERHGLGSRTSSRGASSTSRSQLGSRAGRRPASRPLSASGTAKAALRGQRDSNRSGQVTETVRRAMAESGVGRQLRDDEAEAIEAAMRQARTSGGATEARWTLPPGVWNAGFIEEMPFVRNWPLPGDPRSRASDAARGRGPTLGRKHDIVLQAVERGEAAVAAQRGRVLPSWFDAAERDHKSASQDASAEFGSRGRRHMAAPGASQRVKPDLLPVDDTIRMPSRSGAGPGRYEGGGFVVVERAGETKCE